MVTDDKNIYSDNFYCLLNKSKIYARLFEGRVFILNKVDSTNQYIIDNIKYVKSGDVFVAEYQTSGRGRSGKIWFAPFGKNVCLSIYWKFNYILLPTIMEFSVMVGIFVAKILQNLGISCVRIKWPNDLYINKRKLAGVLVETITRKNYNAVHVIIGIGINLSSYTREKLDVNISSNWISLEDIGVVLDRNMLIPMLVNMLRQRLKYFEYYGFESFLSY